MRFNGTRLPLYSEYVEHFRSDGSSNVSLKSVFKEHCAHMPTVLRIKGYRFFFFSNEGDEPPHIHIESAESYAKFWLNPVCLGYSSGFSSSRITELRILVEKHRNLFEGK